MDVVRKWGAGWRLSVNLILVWFAWSRLFEKSLDKAFDCSCDEHALETVEEGRGKGIVDRR